MKQTRDAQATNFAGYQADWISGFLLRYLKNATFFFDLFSSFWRLMKPERKMLSFAYFSYERKRM